MSSKGKLVTRLSPQVYRRFISKVEELGISYNEAISRAIETWLESFERKERNSNPVQPLMILLTWPMVPVQVPIQANNLPACGYAVPVYGHPTTVQPQPLQLQPQLRYQPQPQPQQGEFLVVSKDALIEPEIPEEKPKLPSPEETQEILNDIESNPWTNILREKGRGE